MNKERVKYNFIMKVPPGSFTVQELMAANPGVSYITLHMRLKKGLKDKTFDLVGLQRNAKKRGCPQKVYAEVVPIKKVKKVLVVA